MELILETEMMYVLEQVGLEVVLGHHDCTQRSTQEFSIVYGDLIEAE